MTANLREAIRLMAAYTGNDRFDVWDLAGPAKASCRAHVMSALAGRKMPQAKSGVNAIRAALCEMAGVTGGCQAERDDNLRDYCRKAVQS